MVNNLHAYTEYSFRVTSRDVYGYYNDDTGALLVTTTYIPGMFSAPCCSALLTLCAAPGAIQLGESTSTSLSISWTASALAEMYNVYYRPLTGARNVSAGFTFDSHIDAGPCFFCFILPNTL